MGDFIVDHTHPRAFTTMKRVCVYYSTGTLGTSLKASREQEWLCPSGSTPRLREHEKRLRPQNDTYSSKDRLLKHAKHLCLWVEKTNKMFLFIIMQGMQATISTDVIKLAHKIHHKPSDKPLSYCYKIGKFQKHHKMAKDKTHFIFPLLIEIKSLYSHFNNRL